MKEIERVMMLTWEFPPRIVGGISTHVYNLSRNLAQKGLDVYVMTCDFPGAPEFEEVDGVHVVRIDSYKSPSPDFATWIYLMNMNMQKESASMISRLKGKVDLLHAHDWLVANAAIGLKHMFRIPLLVTIHSTEIGRRNGLHTNYERMIHQTESWLCHEAWKVVCCSEYMASHVKWAFGLPQDKVSVIPNGVNVKDFEKTFDKAQFRSKFAYPDEKIVLYVGRLVHEKGVQTLIGAVPKVLARVNAKFVIVGDGYMKNTLMSQVNHMNLSNKVYFTGFIDSESLHALYQCADVCVVPSMYEPFGITALEAMASKTPVVVSDTGGLKEIVEHDKTGVKVFPNNAESLAWGITRVLLDPAYAEWIKSNAFKTVLEKYDWSCIAERTKELYELVYREYQAGSWKPT
ncbi:MAG: glycosyltransferase family 4 protein [Candidatus Bathyarchaeia archaeon]